MAANVWAGKGDSLHRPILCKTLVRRRVKREKVRQGTSKRMAGHKQLIIRPDSFQTIFVHHVGNFVVLRCARVFSLTKQIGVKSGKDTQNLVSPLVFFLDGISNFMKTHSEEDTRMLASSWFDNWDHQQGISNSDNKFYHDLAITNLTRIAAFICSSPRFLIEILQARSTMWCSSVLIVLVLYY